MSLQDFEKMQRDLHLLHKEKTSLLEQNFNQKAQIEQLTARVTELETIVNNNPIKFTVQRFDPQISNTYNRILDQRMGGMKYEICYLIGQIQDKSHLITALEKKVIQQQQYKEEAVNQIEQQKINMRNLKALLQRSEREVNSQRALFKQSNQKLQKILEQKTQLSEQVRQEQAKNHNLLFDVARRATSIRPEKPTQPDTNLNIQADFQTLKSLTEMQQSELQERNQQVANLKVISGNPYDCQQENLKNTIKHLRGEVSRYTNLIKTVNQQLAFAEEVIKKYSNAAQGFKEHMATLGRMSELLEQKQATIRSLNKQLKQKEVKLDQQMKQMNNLKAQTVEVLNENQTLQYGLFRLTGRNDKNCIEEIREDFERRQRDRRNREKWSTVQELVTVNLRLKNRLASKV